MLPFEDDRSAARFDRSDRFGTGIGTPFISVASGTGTKTGSGSDTDDDDATTSAPVSRCGLGYDVTRAGVAEW